MSEYESTMTAAELLANPALRVARGASLLDEKVPDWWNGHEQHRINIPTLAMSKPDRCILGQLYQSEDEENPYNKGLLALGCLFNEEGYDMRSISRNWQVDYGFEGVHHDGDYMQDHENLQNCWIAEIYHRRLNATIKELQARAM